MLKNYKQSFKQGYHRGCMQVVLLKSGQESEHREPNDLPSTLDFILKAVQYRGRVLGRAATRPKSTGCVKIALAAMGKLGGGGGSEVGCKETSFQAVVNIQRPETKQ